MKKIWIVYLLLFACFALYVLDYRSQSRLNEQWNSRGLQGSIDEKYVMVTFQMGIDYWKSGLKGFEDAAQALNVSVEYRGSTQRDIHEQITVLEQAIAKKPAGIAISAIHPTELTATINKAVDAGIPVVLFDSDAPGSRAFSFLGTDNYSASVEAARKMAELTGGRGEVAIVTVPDQQNHQERTDFPPPPLPPIIEPSLPQRFDFYKKSQFAVNTASLSLAILPTVNAFISGIGGIGFEEGNRYFTCTGDGIGPRSLRQRRKRRRQRIGQRREGNDRHCHADEIIRTLGERREQHGQGI